MSRSTFVRQPLPQVSRRYDRMARWYRVAEITILLPHRLRRKAVQRLALEPGETVLEIGCGTGRNLPLLCDAVGDDGRVIGVDASSGMLARAQQWVTNHRGQNVRLLLQDAAELTLPGQVDAVLFSLSYSVLPDRETVLQKTWEALRPDGRLVVMDAGLPASPLGRVLGPIGEAIPDAGPDSRLLGRSGRSGSLSPRCGRAVDSQSVLKMTWGSCAFSAAVIASRTARSSASVLDLHSTAWLRLSRSSPTYASPAQPLDRTHRS